MNIWNLIETMIDFITSFKGFNKSKSVEKVNINENVDTDEKEEEMPAKLNVNGQWKDVKSAHANVNGEWKNQKSSRLLWWLLFKQKTGNKMPYHKMYQEAV